MSSNDDISPQEFADLLEPALAARPGRVDPALELPPRALDPLDGGGRITRTMLGGDGGAALRDLGGGDYEDDWED